MQTTSTDRTTKLLLAAIALFLGMIAVRPYVEPPQTVRAESAFDHITIVATSWIRNGRPGLLMLDRRNGNVWFMTTPTDKNNPVFGEPDFVVRLPLEKLQQLPAGQ